ncbi:MAG: hypothetical protein O7J95_05770 [Planctomycetota bacterium]|nr:hypothetical protein [Planctomycetota bacterium]
MRRCHGQVTGVSVVLAAVLSWAVAGCTSDEVLGLPTAKKENVSVFTSEDELFEATGTDLVRPEFVLATRDGFLVLFDGISRSLVLLDGEGRASLLTDQAELETVAGSSPVILDSLDEIRSGSLEGEFVGADTVSGLVLRIALDGTAEVHADETQMTAATGFSRARASLPRWLNNRQIIAQELESGDILLFDDLGNARVFVDSGVFADAAGLFPGDADAAGWVRGAGTGSQYAWFGETNHIVRVQLGGATDRFVDGELFFDLFPDFLEPRVLKITAVNSAVDILFVLVGDGPRGAVVARIATGPHVISVFTSEDDFLDLLGPAYDLSDLGVVDGETLYGVDAGTAQVLLFATEGLPEVIGERESIEDASGSLSPRLSVSAALDPLGPVVFEADSLRHLLVE